MNILNIAIACYVSRKFQTARNSQMCPMIQNNSFEKLQYAKCSQSVRLNWSDVSWAMNHTGQFNGFILTIFAHIVECDGGNNVTVWSPKGTCQIESVPVFVPLWE